MYSEVELTHDVFVTLMVLVSAFVQIDRFLKYLCQLTRISVFTHSINLADYEDHRWY